MSALLYILSYVIMFELFHYHIIIGKKMIIELVLYYHSMILIPYIILTSISQVYFGELKKNNCYIMYAL